LKRLAASNRAELEGKLPESLFQIIREFEEKKGALIAIAVFRFAPDDDSFDRHPLHPEARILKDAADENLRPDIETPAGGKAHAAIGDLDSAVFAELRIHSVIKIERGTPLRGKWFSVKHTRKFANLAREFDVSKGSS
jgi:hypothetical protein